MQSCTAWGKFGIGIEGLDNLCCLRLGDGLCCAVYAVVKINHHKWRGYHKA